MASSQQPVTLQPPNGQVPTIDRQAGPNNTTMLGFAMMTQTGPAPTVIVLPAGGWDAGAGMVGVWPAGTTDLNTQPSSLGMGAFQYTSNNGRSIRYTVPQWQADGIGLGPICIGFESRGQGDVQLSGSRVCVLDGQCQQVAGCGNVP